MDSSDLTPLQGEQLVWQVRRRYEFLAELCRRMRARGFPERDPLLRAAEAARVSMCRLYYEATGPCEKSATCRANKWMRDR